jgi:beta-xylosidase
MTIMKMHTDALIRFRKVNICLLFILSCFITHATSQTSSSNDTSIIRLADPTIFKHKNNFYLYGTVGGNAGNGFLVYVSDDLKKWKLSKRNDGYALRKGDAFGTAGFWAPQVFLHNKKFYMAYTANENIAIAESDHPAGPFKQKIKQALSAEVKQIDPFIFIDDDGKKYLYHVRLTAGNRIFVAEMNGDFSSIKPETLKECIAATGGWENTAKANWPVAEGPSIVKHRKLYYLFYSANDFRSPDYAVGYATSDHPLGPWMKHTGNPVLNKWSIGQNGPGHGDFFINKNTLNYVFHTHNDSLRVAPRKTALVGAKFVNNKERDSLVIDPTSFYFLLR